MPSHKRLYCRGHLAHNNSGKHWMIKQASRKCSFCDMYDRYTCPAMTDRFCSTNPLWVAVGEKQKLTNTHLGAAYCIVDHCIWCRWQCLPSSGV